MKKFDTSFFKALMILAFPIILQNLVTASLNLLDNIMIGHLGVSEIASIGLSNQYYLIFFLTISGSTLGAGIFMSQFWGRKDIENIKKFLGISLIFSLGFAIFYTIIAMFYPESIIKIFTHDINVIKSGTSYLKNVAPSYIFTCLSLAFSVALRSTEQTSIPMKASVIGLVFNGILNYIFIFGKLGFEPMGVKGAALGTTFARFAEFLFILYMVYLKNNIIKSSIKELFNFTFFTVKSYIKTAIPVVSNDFMWIVGITFYSKAYALIGTDAIATMQIATIVNNLFLIFGIGIAVAASILIGNNIGANKSFSEIQSNANKISYFAIVLGIIIGIIFIFISPIATIFFNVSDKIKSDIIFIIRTMAILLPFRFYGVLQIIGNFRGGGDVIYAIFCEMLALWGVGIPLAFFAVLVLKLPIIYVYCFVCLEDIAKVILVYPRLKSGKWIKKLI